MGVRPFILLLQYLSNIIEKESVAKNGLTGGAASGLKGLNISCFIYPHCLSNVWDSRLEQDCF